jgi:hypothetical protein
VRRTEKVEAEVWEILDRRTRNGQGEVNGRLWKYQGALWKWVDRLEEKAV